MIYDGESNTLLCEYCNTTYTPQTIRRYQKRNSELIHTDSGFTCSSCGATVLDTTGSQSCPYCGSSLIVTAVFENSNKPDLIIPFGISKKHAVSYLCSYINGLKYHPREMENKKAFKEIKGCYVPFWFLSCKVKGDLSFTGEKSYDNQTETVVEKYNIMRTGIANYKYLPFDASSVMPDNEMDDLEPYDYEGVCRYNDMYLAGYSTNKYDVEVESLKDRLRERIHEHFISGVTNEVSGYNTLHLEHFNISISGTDTKLGLLPVWIVHYNHYRFYINGQTGKVVGHMPLEYKQICKPAAVVSSVVMCLTSFLLYRFVGSNLIIWILTLVIGELVGLYTFKLLKRITNEYNDTTSISSLNEIQVTVTEWSDTLKSVTKIKKDEQ